MKISALIKYIKKILKKYNYIYYVGSSDILPEPLSKEEEVKYVELSMQGDKFARNKLIEHNLRLVVFLAKKYENTNIDLNKFLVIDRFKWENTDVDLDKIKQLVREGKKEEYHDYLLSFMSSKLQKRNMELVWQASWEALYEKEQGKY